MSCPLVMMISIFFWSNLKYLIRNHFSDSGSHINGMIFSLIPFILNEWNTLNPFHTESLSMLLSPLHSWWLQSPCCPLSVTLLSSSPPRGGLLDTFPSLLLLLLRPWLVDISLPSKTIGQVSKLPMKWGRKRFNYLEHLMHLTPSQVSGIRLHVQLGLLPHAAAINHRGMCRPGPRTVIQSLPYDNTQSMLRAVST